MTVEQDKVRKRKVAWGITGAGDRLAEFIGIMKEVKKEHEAFVDIHVFVSKAGETVLRFYRLETELKQSFEKIQVEVNANSPFLAAWLQNRKYDFLLIAPATSNTVAKIVNGIGDTMITNAAIMSLKAFVHVYIVPTDYEEGVIFTKLPNGKDLRLRVRREEVEQVRKLESMDRVHVLYGPHKIKDAFREALRQNAG